MKNKVIAIILTVGMLLCFFTGCGKATKVIADTDTIYIARTGTETLIIDRTADKEYTYRTTRVKKENAPTEPKTSQKTDTIEIVLLPGGSMEITDIVGGKVYTIQRKGLF